MIVNQKSQLHLAKILMFCFGILTSIAFANTPSDSSVNRLSELMPYEDVFFETLIAPIANERQMLIYSLANDESLSDEQRQNALNIFDEYADNMMKSVDTPSLQTALKQAYIAAAKQHYTQAEVDAQIAFYGSEAGKSALAKQAQVLSSYLQSSAPAGLGLIENYQRSHLMGMQDRMKQALNK